MVDINANAERDRQAPSQFNKSSSLGPLAIGLALGAAFYFIIALGILYTLFGDGGWLVRAVEINGETVKNSYWIGRILSSPINLFSLMAFGGALMMLLSRKRELRQENDAFQLDLLGPEETLLLPEDALTGRQQIRQMDDSKRRLLAVSLLEVGLQRARANWSAEDVGTAIKSQADIYRDKNESDMATVRYLAWAIPSIGFVGTVMGIGEAMGSLKPAAMAPTTAAEEAAGAAIAAPDPLSLAAGHLNMAFDTTFVALVLSLILMYFLYRVQGDEDSLMARATDWTLRRLPLRMHIPQEARHESS